MRVRQDGFMLLNSGGDIVLMVPRVPEIKPGIGCVGEQTQSGMMMAWSSKRLAVLVFIGLELTVLKSTR